MERWSKTIIVILVVIIGWFGYLYWDITRAGAREAKGNGDVAIVIGGPEKKKNDNAAAVERVAKAAQLVTGGQASSLFISDGLGANPKTEVSAMTEIAKNNGVDQGAMITDDRSRNLRQTMLQVQKTANDREWTTVIIVAEPFYLRRAQLTARELGLTALKVPVRSSTINRSFTDKFLYTVKETGLITQFYFSYGTRFLEGALNDFYRQLTRHM